MFCCCELLIFKKYHLFQFTAHTVLLRYSGHFWKSGNIFQVIQHIGEIRDPDSSIAVIYMRKCVRSLQNKSNQSSLASSAYGELPGQVGFDLLVILLSLQFRLLSLEIHGNLEMCSNA